MSPSKDQDDAGEQVRLLPDSSGTTRRAIGRSKNAGSTLTLRLAFGVNPQLWERESTQQRDERRFIAIGIVEGSTIAVVWTPRGSDRRIISARKASRKERKQYGTAVKRAD